MNFDLSGGFQGLLKSNVTGAASECLSVVAGGDTAGRVELGDVVVVGSASEQNRPLINSDRLVVCKKTKANIFSI